jgi:ketosteroid isomerase-like protein
MTSPHESSVADRDSTEIVRRSYRAYVDKDRSAIERLLTEDFHFTSPLDNRIDRKTCFERCWPNSVWIDGFEFIGVVPSDDRVYVTCVGHSDRGRSVGNTEVLTVRDGKIVEVEVYFGWKVPHPAQGRASAGPGIYTISSARRCGGGSLLVVRRVEVVPADIFALEGLAQPDPYASAAILGDEDGAGGLERDADFVDRFVCDGIGRADLERVDH